MKLPNGEQAIVELEKLKTYCLNQQHPRGRHKARVFAAVGIQEEHAELLQKALLEAAQNGAAKAGVRSPYGARCVVDFDFRQAGGAVRIRSAWMIREGEDLPRLTTCSVL